MTKGLKVAVTAALILGTMIMSKTDKSANAGTIEYPKAMKQNVIDDYHGTRVADPYRWLEDPDADETVSWTSKQNELTRRYIDAYPLRGRIEARLRELWDYERYGTPIEEGGRYFYTRNDGLQNQSVLYVRDSLHGDEKLVLDPNELSDDGTVALSEKFISRDGKLLAYALSRRGSDWQEIKIKEVDSGSVYDETLRWCKFSYVAWAADNSGFWYNRFPAEGEVPTEDRNSYNRVYWHELGTPQSQDALVFENKEDKETGYWPYTTRDGRYLVLLVYRGTDPRNGIYVRRTDSDGPFVHVTELDLAKFELIDNDGSEFFFVTDLDAPRGRIIAIDVERPARKNWREIVPATDKVIDYAVMVADRFVVAMMRDAHHELEIYDRQGTLERSIDLPAMGTIEKLSGSRDDSEMFFEFSSFVYPTTIYRYDFSRHRLSAFHTPAVDIDRDAYETEQVFYESKDGTRVPMFLVYKKSMRKDGRNPTWLYGYGGFNISLTPWFSVSRMLWLENGGIVAVANIRGGEEYGEEWHQQGILDRKQNVFDDFIAAAEYLVAEDYTSRSRLVINGGSNGGLLVAACMVQRPELFGAVVCQVPVIDMLRYHKFTVGKYWVSDYGNAEADPEQFEFLYAYSPLHNISPGETHPSTLITSADTDDRVVSAHAKKFAAALQAYDSGENPILLRVDVKAGHGGGKPTAKIIEEYADICSFMFKALEAAPTTLTGAP